MNITQVIKRAVKRLITKAKLAHTEYRIIHLYSKPSNDRVLERILTRKLVHLRNELGSS